jgi:hypothetical protein
MAETAPIRERTRISAHKNVILIPMVDCLNSGREFIASKRRGAEWVASFSIRKQAEVHLFVEIVPSRQIQATRLILLGAKGKAL